MVGRHALLALTLQGFCVALSRRPGLSPASMGATTRRLGPLASQSRVWLHLLRQRGGGDEATAGEVARQREERKKAKAEEKRKKKLAKEHAPAASAGSCPDVSYTAAGHDGLPEEWFGNLFLVQSREQDTPPQTRMEALRSVAGLSSCTSGQNVWVRARVQNVRFKGNSCFLVLRQGAATVQATLFKAPNVSKSMLRFCGDLPKASNFQRAIHGQHLARSTTMPTPHYSTKHGHREMSLGTSRP